MPGVDLELPCKACAGNKPFAFISYAHLDAEVVFPEIARFHGMGYPVWYDEGIDPGNEWPEVVADFLQRSAQFVVFVSRRAIRSRNVRNEIHYALQLEKPFLAIHLEETNLTGGLALLMSSIQAVLKWRMNEQTYLRNINRALPSTLGSLPESLLGQEGQAGTQWRAPAGPPTGVKACPSDRQPRTVELQQAGEGAMEAVESAIGSIKTELKPGRRHDSVEDADSGRVYHRLKVKVGESAVPALVTLLESKDRMTRWKALRLLMYFKFQDADRLRVTWEREDEETVRYLLASECTNALPAETAILLLCEVAAYDDSARVRLAALQEIGRRATVATNHISSIATADAVVRESLYDNEPEIRRTALLCLAEEPAHDIEPIALELLRDRDTVYVRSAAAQVLADHGGIDAAKDVFEVLGSRHLSTGMLRAYGSRFKLEELMERTAHLDPVDAERIRDLLTPG